VWKTSPVLGDFISLLIGNSPLSFGVVFQFGDGRIVLNGASLSKIFAIAEISSTLSE
jgi:hypothetical protein